MEASEFFDENSDFYDPNLLKYDYEFMEFIKNGNGQNISILDVGGGSGNFSKLIMQNCVNVNITILDPSEKLLNKVNNPKINKINGKLPDSIPINSKFDFIHIKNVLHHITGSTVLESKLLVKNSLNNLKMLLNDDGFLLIHDLCYEGFLIPKFPNYLIFYLLKLQNKLNVKIPFKEFLLGLNVYFYTKNELESILNECGFQIIEFKFNKWDDSTQKKVMLIKNWGILLIIAKKNK